jgi:outer membrane protein assembly factor BamD
MIKFCYRFCFLAVALMALASCSEYQKIVNSTDVVEKYKAAQDYYDKGEYKKAIRLFEIVKPSFSGKPQNERLVYFFANAYYQNKDYYLAAYQYENFVKSYPKSDRVEEASFYAAKCYYHQSPIYSLDQKDTFEALEKLQVFLNKYPQSSYSDEANQLILELQTKIEQKDFEIAKQYYTIRDYKAAVKALDNFISEYPGTKFREEALYQKFNAAYEIAINSFRTVMKPRLEELQQLHQTIFRYYPETLFSEDLNQKIEEVEKLLRTFAPPTESK